MTTEAALESTLLDVAHPQVYIRNAFRDTGLAVDATQQDVVRCGDRLRMAAKLGGAMPTGPLPTDPAANEDEIRDALRRMQNPERRLIEELFWFWPTEDSSSADEALRELAAGRVEDAVEIWGEIREFDSDTGVATHNLAVYSHLIALDMESRLLAGSGLSEQEGTTLEKAWKDALGLWTELLESDNVWSRFEKRIRDIDDPRLTIETGKRIREELPAALLSINARLAVDFAEREQTTQALRHRQLMFGSSLGAEGLQTALRRAVEPIRTRLKVLGELAAEEADNDPVQGKTAADSLLEQATPLVGILDAVLPDGHPALEAVHDEIALKVLACQVAYGNRTNDWDGSIATLERASAFASSESARQRIESELSTARSNSELGDSFCGPSYYDQPKEFLDRMERARRAADELRWEEAVQILLKILKKDDLTDEQRALARKALAFCLDGKALKRLNAAVEKLNRPPKIIEKIHRRAQKEELDSYTLMAASMGLQNEFSSLRCMACGCMIHETYMKFTYNDVECIVCLPCSQNNDAETERKKKELRNAINEIAPDLLLAAELDPDNNGVKANLEGLRDIASQEGVSLPSNAVERRVELGLVSVAELVDLYTNGGWSERSAARKALEEEAPEVLAQILARRRAKITKWAKYSSIAAAAVIVLYNLVGGIVGIPGPTYRFHRMGLMGTERTVGALARAMARGDLDAREKSVERLVEIGTAAIPQMLEALRSESMRARESAASVIVRLGDAATPVLFAATSHEDPNVRAAAAAVIGSLSITGPNGQSLLDSLSNDPHEEVVTAARIANRHINRAIVVGDTLVGKLDSNDEPAAGTGNRGRFVEQWRLLASEGECFAVQLTSLDTWTYLSVSGPGLNQPMRNNGGFSSGDRLSICAQMTGIYQVTAAGNAYGIASYALAVDSASEAEATTVYSERVVASARPPTIDQPPVRTCAENSLPAGNLLSGVLENGRLESDDPTCLTGLSRSGRYMEKWTFEGTNGQLVTIDMMSSNVDPYLIVTGPGISSPRTNDDGGDGNSARINLRLPRSGTFNVYASTYSARDPGPYTIRLRESGTPSVATTRAPAPAPARTTAAAPACDPTILPVGELRPDVELRGELGREDPICLVGIARTGRFMEKWALRGTEGQRITIDMVSSEVDPYLMIRGPGISSMRTDDDGGSGNNARLELTIPQTGTYEVYASTFSERDPGSYTIRLIASAVASQPRRAATPAQPSPQASAPPEQAPQPSSTCASPEAVTGTLRAGRTLSGSLNQGDPTCATTVTRTGRYIDIWTLQGSAGQRVTIDLMSTQIDPYLMITGPGLRAAQTDDDGGDGNNARLQLTLPQTGSYSVYASAYSERSAGSYTIRLASSAPANAPAATSTACDVIPPISGMLMPNEVSRGEFTSYDPTCMRGFDRAGRHVDLWVFNVDRAQNVTVDMMSNQVDSYLALYSPETSDPPIDDDGGDGNNARLTVRAQAGTPTVIIATTYGERDTGSYTIRLRLGGN